MEQESKEVEDLSNESKETLKEEKVIDEEPKNVNFKIVFNKEKLDITWDSNKTIATLKTHIHNITGVPPAMQKLMFKGLVKNDHTLSEVGIMNGSKMMLVGSKLTDVISINAKTTEKSSSSKSDSSNKKEPLSKQKPHLKVIERGAPDDAMPAYINGHESLPDIPLFGMVNKYGNKVRLTFKLESDQVWLGTKERTEKLPMNSIKNVISEPIYGHAEYHMMALQLGPTEQSRYWIYWVPAQYVNAVKDIILR